MVKVEGEFTNEHPHQSTVKIEQLCQAWWRWEVSYVYTTLHTQFKKKLQSWLTKPTNTEYTPITWENLEVFFLSCTNPSIGQLSHTNPTPPTFSITATAANIYTTHALTIINRFWVSPQAPQPFIYPFVYQPTCTTVSLTHAHNQANRVSEVDSTSLWRAFPQVLSDTPTECVTQLINVPSLKQTPDTMQNMQ